MAKLLPGARCGLTPTRAAVVFFLAGSLVWGTIASARQQVTVRVDGKILHIKTLQHTVGAALDEAGIKLEQYDEVKPALASQVKRGMVVTVNRAVHVSIIADGRKQDFVMPPASVHKVLKTAGISLSPQDRVNLPLNTVIRDGMTVRVTRVAEKLVAEKYLLPAPLERKPDPSLEKGRTRLVRGTEIRHWCP